MTESTLVYNKHIQNNGLGQPTVNFIIILLGNVTASDDTQQLMPESTQSSSSRPGNSLPSDIA